MATNRKIIQVGIAIFTLTAILSCGSKRKKDTTISTNENKPLIAVDSSKSALELMRIDSAFSAYSVKNGINDAFINYISDDGVLLRPKHNPIVGKDSVVKLLSNKKTSNMSMQWKPSDAYVAKSGELGYTYGVYELSGTGPKGNPIRSSGTYVSIWKKDAAGNWKLALDSGNEGLVPLKKARRQKK